MKVRKQLGVEQKLLTPHEIHDLEPHIKQIYHGGSFISKRKAHKETLKKFYLNYLIYFQNEVENF